MAWQTINRILIGILFLFSGVWKIAFVGVDGISGMVGGIILFSWAPVAWAWILIASEIIFGLAILANFKLRYTIWPLIAIMIVAGLFIGAKFSTQAPYLSWSGLLFHLIIIVNLLILAGFGNKEKKEVEGKEQKEKTNLNLMKGKENKVSENKVSEEKNPSEKKVVEAKSSASYSPSIVSGTTKNTVVSSNETNKTIDNNKESSEKKESWPNIMLSEAPSKKASEKQTSEKIKSPKASKKSKTKSKKVKKKVSRKTKKR